MKRDSASANRSTFLIKKEGRGGRKPPQIKKKKYSLITATTKKVKLELE